MKKIKNCAYCNQEFETQNNKKQYCSNSCRVSACRNGIENNLQGNFSEKNSILDEKTTLIQELEAKNEALRNENLKFKTELNFLKAALVENEHRFKLQNQNLKQAKHHFDKKLNGMEKLLHQIEKNTQKVVWDKIIPFVPVVATALSTLFTNSKMEQNNLEVKKALEAVQSLVKANSEKAISSENNSTINLNTTIK